MLFLLLLIRVFYLEKQLIVLDDELLCQHRVRSELGCAFLFLVPLFSGPPSQGIPCSPGTPLRFLGKHRPHSLNPPAGRVPGDFPLLGNSVFVRSRQVPQLWVPDG
jgi:hypothetical protein